LSKIEDLKKSWILSSKKLTNQGLIKKLCDTLKMKIESISNIYENFSTGKNGQLGYKLNYDLKKSQKM
jgi:hypothetical protein